MTARLDVGGLGIALQLFLDPFRRQGMLWPLLIPEQDRVGDGGGTDPRTGAQGCQGIRGDINDPILAPFALGNAQGLLVPVEVGWGQARDFTDAQATAQDE